LLHAARDRGLTPFLGESACTDVAMPNGNLGWIGAEIVAIRVDAGRVVASVSPLIYGAVDFWFDEFCHPSSEHYRDVVEKVDLAGVTNFRMGGTPTEYYHWRDPQEYLETQECVVKGKRLYGDAFPEEYGKMAIDIENLAAFARDTASMSDLIIGVNFMRGTAEEAAAWVRRANVEKKLNVRYWEIGNELGECIDRSWFPPIELPKKYPIVSPDRSPGFYYSGGVVHQNGEILGRSSGRPNQVFRLNFPPVQGEIQVYVDEERWTRASDIRDAAGEDAFQYRESYTPAFYWKGEVTFGDGKQGKAPHEGVLIKANYNSGPHDGLVDYIAAMKAVDPTIKILASADEMDWWHTGLTRWTRELPLPQQLWSVLFVVDILGTFAKNGIRQASLTHVFNYLKTDGILSYDEDPSGRAPATPMPIYFGIQLMKNHFGQLVVEALSDDYPSLRVYAGIDKERNPTTLCVLMLNRDETYSITETIHIKGAGAGGLEGKIWTLNGDGVSTDEGISLNGTDLSQLHPQEVAAIPPEEVKTISDSFSYTFPPHSLTVMEFPVG